MTRRTLLATLIGVPITQRSIAAEQFIVEGHFTEAGADPHLAYFALGQSLSLTLDPQKLPTMVKQAEALIGQQVRLRLERA
jgi:siroheme synthase